MQLGMELELVLVLGLDGNGTEAPRPVVSGPSTKPCSSPYPGRFGGGGLFFLAPVTCLPAPMASTMTPVGGRSLRPGFIPLRGGGLPWGLFFWTVLFFCFLGTALLPLYDQVLLC